MLLLNSASLNRSFDYKHLGRLQYAHTGSEARMHVTGQPNDGGGYGPYSQHTYYDVWGNVTGRLGWGGNYGSYTNWTLSYAGNRRTDQGYDPAGNMTYDGGQYTYDATGQQTNATYPPNWNGYTLQQGYNGDRLRVKKVDNSTPTYYLRSSVLGGQVLAEVDWQGVWQRGYVYLGGQLLVVQSEGVPKWVHQDPVTKSQRLTDYNLNVVAVVDLDPWGGETGRSWAQGRQPHRYTSYERDGNGNDQAMFRLYHSFWQRFDQPDPYDGSYNLTDPQSLNRYSYVQNDPVNFVDPSGLLKAPFISVVCQNGDCNYSLYWRNIDGFGEDPSIGVGGGDDLSGGGDDPQKPTPTPQPPCSEQDFSFSQGAGGFSARELSEIAQTAVGEASNDFYPDEVETVIGTIGNRLNINRIYAAVGASGGFNGGTSTIGILNAGYDAHKSRSGEKKLNQAKAANGGVLAAGSYVCAQLRAAKNFAGQVGNLSADELYNAYPYTYNLGIGARLQGNEFGVVQIGNTRFFNRPFR